MGKNNEEISWPSAAVGITMVVLVMAVTVAAIIRYPADDALKFWSALGPVIGVLTGAFVTYFFTRRTIATEQANTAAARKRAEESFAAAEELSRHVNSAAWTQAKIKHPVLAKIPRPD